jgi:hypothetical protein
MTKMGRKWKVIVIAYFKGQFLHLSVGFITKREVKIAGVQARLLTKHNTRVQTSK